MPLGDQPVISFLFFSTLPSLFLIVGPLMSFCIFVCIFCHHLLSLAHSSFSLVTLHCAALLRLDSVLQTSEVSESTRLMLVKLCHLVDENEMIMLYFLVH